VIATSEAIVSHELPPNVANISLKDYMESMGASFPNSKEEIFAGFLPKPVLDARVALA